MEQYNPKVMTGAQVPLDRVPIVYRIHWFTKQDKSGTARRRQGRFYCPGCVVRFVAGRLLLSIMSHDRAMGRKKALACAF